MQWIPNQTIIIKMVIKVDYKTISSQSVPTLSRIVCAYLCTMHVVCVLCMCVCVCYACVCVCAMHVCATFNSVPLSLVSLSCHITSVHACGRWHGTIPSS